MTGILPHLWGGSSHNWLITVSIKKYFLCRGKTCPSSTCTHWFLSSPYGSLWIVSLRPLCSCSRIHTGIHIRILLGTSSGQKDLTPSVIPYKAGSWTLWSSSWPSSGSSPARQHVFWIAETRTRRSSTGAAWQTLSMYAYSVIGYDEPLVITLQMPQKCLSVCHDMGHKLCIIAIYKTAIYCVEIAKHKGIDLIKDN